MFSVTLVFSKNGKRARWTGNVAAVPGQNIFDTAAKVCARASRKGRPALIPGASRFCAAF